MAVPVARTDDEAVTEAYVGFADRERGNGGNGSREFGVAEERGMRVSDQILYRECLRRNVMIYMARRVFTIT